MRQYQTGSARGSKRITGRTNAAKPMAKPPPAIGAVPLSVLFSRSATEATKRRAKRGSVRYKVE
jgi:hypothetical protein